MAVSTKSFFTLVQDQVAAIQGGARQLVDFTVGSILRAMVEANAAVVLWLQGLILQLLATTRAATSSASDLDSWVADYGLARLAAVAATGQVTFSRFTSTLQAVVPVGATIQTGDGTQSFTVSLDTTNPAYSAGQGGYVLAAGTASVAVKVSAVTAGAAANVSAGQISTITQAIPGVDTVTNASAFTNGSDAESDVALRTRFIAYIASLSKATKTAVGNAIAGVRAGLSYTVVENLNYAGASQPGYFYAVVDDGTGNPGSSLFTSVSNAIDLVRPLTSTFGVFAPVVVNAAVVMTITVQAGYDPIATKSLAVVAVKNYINALALGQTLAYSRIAQVAYDASPGIVNVTAVTLNSGTADLVATAQQVVKYTSVVAN